MIPITEGRSVFTNVILEQWDELKELQSKSFLRSFATKKTSSTLEVSIEVRRGTEKVAVDVLRGTNGNRNAISRSTERIIVPPYFKEYIDITELQHYDRLFGVNATGTISANMVTTLIQGALEQIGIVKKKIERAYELQVAQVLESGIVLLNTSDNIDFKRKAASMYDATAAGYFNNPNVDPETEFIRAAEFLRKTGKSTDGVFNVIMGSNVYPAFKQNPFIKEKNYNTNIKLIELHMPQANAEGGVLMGQYSAGSYLFNIWTYPEFYEDSTGTMVPYIDENQAIFLPVQSLRMVLAHGGVPAVFKSETGQPAGIVSMEGDYVVNSFIDEEGMKHVFNLQSAGVVVPVSIDRIYTLIAYGTVTNPIAG